MGCKSGTNSARGRVSLWTPSCPPGSTAQGHFRWEVLPNVLVCIWSFQQRTGSCSVMKPLQVICTKQKRKEKKKEKKREHKLACVQKQSSESVENSSTPCFALVLSTCSPSPTKGIRHCPPLKHTLILFRNTFFLKGIYDLIKSWHRKGSVGPTPKHSGITNIRHGSILTRRGSVFCLCCPTLWIRKTNLLGYSESWWVRKWSRHTSVSIFKIYTLKKKRQQGQDAPLFHLGRILALHHVNHVRDLKNKTHNN